MPPFVVGEFSQVSLQIGDALDRAVPEWIGLCERREPLAQERQHLGGPYPEHERERLVAHG
jgi:hypothetical protein